MFIYSFVQLYSVLTFGFGECLLTVYSRLRVGEVVWEFYSMWSTAPYVSRGDYVVIQIVAKVTVVAVNRLFLIVCWWMV